MKITYVFLLLLFNILFSKSSSCEKLMNEVRRYGTLKGSKTPISSTAIVKAEYYVYDDTGFAIIYFKKNDYSVTGTPYVYCNISSQRWKAFVDSRAYGSWGESFNKYIRSYTCSC